MIVVMVVMMMSMVIERKKLLSIVYKLEFVIVKRNVSVLWLFLIAKS